MSSQIFKLFFQLYSFNVSQKATNQYYETRKIQDNESSDHMNILK